jgi:hypothetical protein
MSSQLQEEGATPQARISTDYFVVAGEFCTWYVSTEMARFIESCLDVRRPAEWVKFVDLAGARVRLRVRNIAYLAQCTAEQRAFQRLLYRALDREQQNDEKDWNE